MSSAPARCPPEFPYLCADEECGDRHCCAADALDCEEYAGGLAACTNTDAIVEACPWTADSGVDGHILCSDGTYCGYAGTIWEPDFSNCCQGLTRTACPPEWPVMCANLDCGGQRCCTDEGWVCDSGDLGGKRPCPDFTDELQAPADLAGGCPWLAHSGVPGYFQCADGTYCLKAGDGVYHDCCEAAGVARCPPESPYFCNLGGCNGHRCCGTSAQDCTDNYGGVTTCDDSAERESYCPWTVHSGVAKHMQCMDGRLCGSNGPANYDHCCEHTQRERCPPEFPHMCAAPICTGLYCCTDAAENCDAGAGGLRQCPDHATQQDDAEVWCPWMVTTGLPGTLQCSDGSLCEKVGDWDWTHCCNGIGRARCPPEYPHMCASQYCNNQHCCTDEAELCDQAGGPRPCPDDTDLNVAVGDISGACPWVSSSGVARHMECTTGTLCEQDNFQEYGHCCQGSGRARCPPEIPYMCDDNTSCHGQHCCVADAAGCDQLGGLRSCEDAYLQMGVADLPEDGHRIPAAEISLAVLLPAARPLLAALAFSSAMCA